MNPPRELVAMPDRCPGQISWHYDRTEIIADGVVHAIGVCLGLIGAITIVVMAVKVERINVAPILVYVIGLVTMLAFSAAYNMWPVSPVKWVLRRFDHSAIYLLIAGTYTPFLAQIKTALVSTGLGISVWLSAAVGMALKLALPGRFDRLAIILCLLLGWSGVIAYNSLASAIPSLSLWLLVVGGVFYSLGALFHVWQHLRFHTRSGMVLCCSRQVAIIRRSSLACPAHKRPSATPLQATQNSASARTGIDVVIQSLGVSVELEIILKPTRFFSKATRVLVTAMEEAQVKRLICVTGFGAGNSRGHGGFLYCARFICSWGAFMTTRTCRNVSSAGASSTG